MKRGLKFYLGLIPLSLLALLSFQNCGPSFKSLNSEGQAFSVAAGNDANNNQDDDDSYEDPTPISPVVTPPVITPVPNPPATSTPPIAGSKEFQYNGALVGPDKLPVITGCEARSGVCYYVKPVASGGAGNTCTQANPCSVPTGIRKLGAGDTLYFLSGDYAAYEGSADYLDINRYVRIPATSVMPVTLRGYPGAIFKGNGNTKCGLVDGSSYLTISGLVFDGCREVGFLVGYDAGATTTNLVITNNEFRNISNNDNMGAIIINGASNILFINNKVHDFTHRSYGLGEGCGMVIFHGKNITIQNNEFYHLGSALYYKHGEDADGLGGFTRIYGNYIHDSHNGLLGSNQNRTDIKYNIFDGSNTTASKSLDFYNEDGTCAGNQAGANCSFVKDVVIEYNTFINSRLNEGWVLGGSIAYVGPRNFSVNRNIFYNSHYNILEYASNSLYNSLRPADVINSDYNCFYSNNGSLKFKYFAARGGWTQDYSGWRAQGFDSHSLLVDPGLNLSTYQVSNAACSGYGAFFK